MTTPTSLPVYTQGFGTAFTGAPFVAPNAPTASNILGPNGPFKLGQIWINSTAPQAYTLVALTSSNGIVSATWQSSSGLPDPANFFGVVNFESGSTVNYLAGSTTIVASGAAWTFANTPAFNNGFFGNAGLFQFKTGSTVDFDLGSSTNFGNTPSFGGGFNANVGTFDFKTGTTVDFDLGSSTNFGNTPAFSNGLTVAGGNLNITGASSRILISDAAPATNSIGTTSALTAGSIVVSTTAITAASKVFFSPASLGTVTAPQSYYVSARTPGVSFTITSSDATDTSTVNYLIIN